jgi:hypothetical protein
LIFISILKIFFNFVVDNESFIQKLVKMLSGNSPLKLKSLIKSHFSTRRGDERFFDVDQIHSSFDQQTFTAVQRPQVPDFFHQVTISSVDCVDEY